MTFQEILGALVLAGRANVATALTQQADLVPSDFAEITSGMLADMFPVTPDIVIFMPQHALAWAVAALLREAKEKEKNAASTAPAKKAPRRAKKSEAKEQLDDSALVPEDKATVGDIAHGC